MYRAEYLAVLVVLIIGRWAPCAAQQAQDGQTRPVPEAMGHWFPEEWQDDKVNAEWARQSQQAMDDSLARITRWCDEVKRNGRVVDEELAARLVEELWYDTGLPDTNAVHQRSVLAFIDGYLRSKFTTPTAREVFRSGLIEYYKGGGGDLDQRLAKALHKALADGKHANDAEAEAIMAAIAESWDFEAAGQRTAVTRKAPGRHGARELLRRLRAFERAGGQDSKELAAIIKRACQGFGNERVDGIVRNALLRTYGVLLGRKKNAPPSAVVKLIDADLVRIGKLELKQRTTRLLWAKVVEIMGDRASQRLRSVLAQRLKTERDKAIQGALRRAADRLKR